MNGEKEEARADTKRGGDTSPQRENEEKGKCKIQRNRKQKKKAKERKG